MTYTFKPIKMCMEKEDIDMRTNIVIDDILIKKVMNYTGLGTKKDVVQFALEEIVRRKERKKILGLQGKVHWEGNLDEMRRNRFDDLD